MPAAWNSSRLRTRNVRRDAMVCDVQREHKRFHRGARDINQCARRVRDCSNREQRGAKRLKPIFIAPLRYWPAISNDGLEAAMKTLAARMVLATSVALATLAAAETAYAQDYHSYEAAYVHRRHA